MSGYGMVERMKPAFARALRPLKGGATGVAEVLRMSGNWASTDELVNVHYEQTDAKDGSMFDLSVGGQPGYTVYIDGALDSPLVNGDRLVIAARSLTLKVEREAKRGNLTPGDAVDCMVIDGA